MDDCVYPQSLNFLVYEQGSKGRAEKSHLSLRRKFPNKSSLLTVMRARCLWLGRVSLIEIWIVNWDGLVKFLQRAGRGTICIELRLLELGKYNFHSCCVRLSAWALCMMYLWIAWSIFLLASDTHFYSCRFHF